MCVFVYVKGECGFVGCSCGHINSCYNGWAEFSVGSIYADTRYFFNWHRTKVTLSKYFISHRELGMCNVAVPPKIGDFSFLLQFQKDEGERSEKIPYGYGFFHFVLCLGAMYFAMLFIGWDLEQTMQK